MDIFIISLISLVIGAFLAWYFLTQRKIEIGLPYVREVKLLSNTERLFLNVLDHALGDEYRILTKVRVGSIITTDSDLASKLNQIALEKINTKSFDFVLCNKTDLSIVCVIELKESNSRKKPNNAEENFISKLCEHVLLPLVTIPVKEAYPITQVRTIILAAIGIPDATAMATSAQCN